MRCVLAWCDFRAIWFDVHSEESWCANPEVVALTFEVRKVNIDKMERAA